ncbi:unnamed protein product, partial [Fusarium langsethiae]
EGSASNSLPRRNLAFPEESSIGGDISELKDDDDDDGSEEAGLVAIGPALLPLPDLWANVPLLVAEEKSDRNVPELAAPGGVLLPDAADRVARTLDEDEREEEAIPPPLRSLGFDRIFDMPLAFWRSGTITTMVMRILYV